MQIIRTIGWVLVAVILLIFSINNWTPVEVKIWESLVLETKIPALVIVSFLVGLLPVLLLYTGMRWRLNRRIKSLETALRSAVAASTPQEPVRTAESSPAYPEESLQPRRDEEL